MNDCGCFQYPRLRVAQDLFAESVSDANTEFRKLFFNAVRNASERSEGRGGLALACTLFLQLCYALGEPRIIVTKSFEPVPCST